MSQDCAQPARGGAGLAANLAAGFALARGQRVASGAFAGSLGHVLAALALVAALAALADRLQAGAEAGFWVWGLAAEAARLQVWLLAAAALAWLTGRAGAFATLVVALAYAWLPVWAVTFVVPAVAAALGATLTGDARLAFEVCAGAWYLAVLWRALAMIDAPRLRLGTAAAGIYVLAFLGVTRALPEGAIFYRPQPEPPPALDIEAVYYRQRALLEAALAELRPGVPGERDLFFVGIGGYAAEDVFMREVQQVRALFERELGAAGRAVSLINNPGTVWNTPLANRYNLAEALTRIAAVMDVEEDVLFLFLTSHGHEDATVAVRFRPLGLTDIDAQALRGMLDEAGIRWRVIVISACYSGSFIDELASPQTLVITAAASDRASFGCAHENAWTYFGRAYFDEALRETRDFVEAFTLASASVELREGAEGKPASRPQIRLGGALRSHLARDAASTSACCSEP